MKQVLVKVWREPVLFGAVIVAALNAALFLPSWREAVASVAASVAAAVGVRSRVSPK